MPLPAPVTTTTLPSQIPLMTLLLLSVVYRVPMPHAQHSIIKLDDSANTCVSHADLLPYPMVAFQRRRL